MAWIEPAKPTMALLWMSLERAMPCICYLKCSLMAMPLFMRLLNSLWLFKLMPLSLMKPRTSPTCSWTTLMNSVELRSVPSMTASVSRIDSVSSRSSSVLSRIVIFCDRTALYFFNSCLSYSGYPDDLFFCVRTVLILTAFSICPLFLSCEFD